MIMMTHSLPPLCLVLMMVMCCAVSISAETTITLGASLSSEAMEQEFRLAVNSLNANFHASKIRFNASTILMDNNPIRSALDVCDKLLNDHVHTVLASHPNSTNRSPISVSYTCGYYKIPVVGISARDSAFSDVKVHEMFLRTVPPYDHQADVWVQLLVNLTWHKVIFVYSADEEGRSILSQFQSLAESNEREIRIEPPVKYTPGEESYTETLKEILKPDVTSRVILLTASTEDAFKMYRDAEALGMVGEGWAWIVSEQAFEASNIPIGFLGVHLVDGKNEVKHIQDAVTVIGHTFTQLLSKSQTLSNPPTKCENDLSWRDGQKVYDKMVASKLQGETGQISFTKAGDRKDPIYEIRNIYYVDPKLGFRKNRNVAHFGNKYKPEGLRIVPRFNITWPGNTQEKPKGEKISRNLTIVTLKESPFVDVTPMPKDGVCREIENAKNSYRCTNGTKEYCCSGYCMDMLNEIATKVKFDYTIHLSRDGLYGSFEKHNGSQVKKWNGMMGQLIDKEADLIVAPLTINPERANEIDFTKPFKYQGLNILVRKTQKDSSLASFLQPFQDTLWILVGLSVHVVALVLYLLDRFSPFGRFKLAKSDDTEEDALNLSSAMWFSWGVLLNSGIGEGTPRSFSARVLGMVWAGFAMIIVASYTANLAAFLVLDRPEALISGIDDPRLRNPNKKFQYATVVDSATEMYFKRQVELSTMYRNMKDQDKKYYTAEAAIEDIKNGELQAFIWDSPRLEYEAAYNCKLTTAGDLFGRSGLGIGLRKNSPWTHEVSMAVLNLHESGFMENLDNTYILVDSKTECPDTNSAPATLGLTNMAGVFMMVAGGIVAGILLIFVEIAYKRHRGLKEKELELARNAADRWRGNIEKRRTLRMTLAKQREEALRLNSVNSVPKQLTSNNTRIPGAISNNTIDISPTSSKTVALHPPPTTNSIHKNNKPSNQNEKFNTTSNNYRDKQKPNASGSPLEDSEYLDVATPSYRRLSLIEATKKSDCLPPPPPGDFKAPGYVPARSGRTVTWNNSKPDGDHMV